jgi:hypothetical protein
MPRTGSPEVSFPYSVTTPGRPLVAGLPPPPDPSSGFLDLLTVYAAPGLRGLVSCRLRSWDSPYRAFPFQGIRASSEAVAPLRLGARLLLRPSFPADASRTITHGRAEAGPPREGPLRLAVPRRRWSRGCPFVIARPLIHARLAPAPRGPFGSRARISETQHRTGRCDRLLAGVRSTSAPKRCSSWKSVLVALRSSQDDGRCSPGLRSPLELSPSPR